MVPGVNYCTVIYPRDMGDTRAKYTDTDGARVNFGHAEEGVHTQDTSPPTEWVLRSRRNLHQDEDNKASCVLNQQWQALYCAWQALFRFARVDLRDGETCGNYVSRRPLLLVYRRADQFRVLGLLKNSPKWSTKANACDSNI